MDTVKVSGNMASFRTPLDVPIRSLKVHFSPKQAGSGDPSPNNVREILGHTGVNVTHIGKNIFNPFNCPLWNNNTYTVNNDGSVTVAGSDGRGWNSNQMTPLYIPAGTYTFSFTGAQRCQFAMSDNDYTSTIYSKAFTFTASQSTYIKFKLTTSNGYPITCTVQIEKGSIATEYEPYQQQTIPISFGENGTIYGGYVDLISGELVKEWTFYELDGSENWIIATDDSYLATWVSEHSISNTDSTQVINWLQSVSDYTWQRYGKCRAQTNGAIVVGNVGDSPWEDLETFKAYLGEHHLQISYKMDTPITYQLTPQQLNTFFGYNNIWSDADSVEVEYDLAETADIIMTRKRLILNEPHIQTLIGNPASFNTDIRGLLKSCKVEFNPVQEGSGDPSPTNVRAISGWTGITVNRTGKNLFNWDVPRSHASPIASANTTARTFELNTYVVGMSSTNYYRDDITNWVPSFSVSNGVISFTSGGASGYGIAYVMNLVPGDYFISYEKIGSGSVDITYYDSDGNCMSRQVDRMNQTFTVPSDTKTTLICFRASVANSSFTFSNVQIEIASSATTYEPYKGNQIPISFGENGTIYGGYVDLITGNVWETWYKGIITSSMRFSVANESYGGWWFTSGNSYNFGTYNYGGVNSSNPSTQIISDVFTVNTRRGSTNATSAQYVIKTWGNSTGSDRTQFCLSGTPSDETEFRAWLDEYTPSICYMLKDPRVVGTINPEIIKTFKGINNIWSDTNGNIEVKYWTH